MKIQFNSNRNTLFKSNRKKCLFLLLTSIFLVMMSLESAATKPTPRPDAIIVVGKVQEVVTLENGNRIVTISTNQDIKPKDSYQNSSTQTKNLIFIDKNSCDKVCSPYAEMKQNNQYHVFVLYPHNLNTAKNNTTHSSDMTKNNTIHSSNDLNDKAESIQLEQPQSYYYNGQGFATEKEANEIASSLRQEGNK